MRIVDVFTVVWPGLIVLIVGALSRRDASLTESPAGVPGGSEATYV